MLTSLTVVSHLVEKVRTFGRTSLQSRFLLRVLTPPFVILLIVGAAGYWVLDGAVRGSAVDSLRRASETTAAKLDREFALRRVVLRSTGSELFTIKSEYSDKRTQLETNRNSCKAFVQINSNFLTAPGNVCQPFLAEFAAAMQRGTSLSGAVETGYANQVNDLNSREQVAVRERLEAFVEFFPETSYLRVTDKKGGVISQATTGETVSKEYSQEIKAIAKKAVDQPVEAKFIASDKNRQLAFAYPIEKGAVIASYNLDHAGFIHQSWKSAPVDSTKAYLVIASENSTASYPKLDDDSLYRPVLGAHQGTKQVAFTSSGVDYLAVSQPVGQTSWRVIVSSPMAIALESLANAQIIAVAVIGFLIVSFLWVGSIFVHRTIGSILGLVGGALVFAGGRLDHRIDATQMSDKEFSQLATIMNSMAGQIQTAQEAIDQKNKEFISVATHEIKAPMTAIIGNLSMLLEDGYGKIDEEAREIADQAYQGTIRLRNLVNELLDIARLESGQAKFNLQPLDIKKELTDMIELQKTPANENQIEIFYQPSEGKTMVMADQTKLEIILTNFISNAIKYNRSPGKVAIAYERIDGFVMVTVSDTGLGIPAEQQEHMFQKFFRVEGSDRAGIPGTGLGMYITKQFIEGMGGKLWFESEAGQGTAFHFTLPLTSQES